jgi:hypothetical protein
MTAVEFDCALKLLCSWVFSDIFPADRKHPTYIDDLLVKFDFIGATQQGIDIFMAFFNVNRPLDSS